MIYIEPFDELKRKVVLHVQPFAHYSLEIRALSLTRDIPVIHKWVNMDYAKAFWQMQGPYKEFYHHYEKFLSGGLGSSIVFFFPGDINPVAQMDFYNAQLDEVGAMYESQPDDIGIHLLMGPNTKRVKGLTTSVMVSGISYLFSIGAKRIIGEPDVNNVNANQLVKRLGFQLVKRVQLSYKSANLYLLEPGALKM